MGGLFNWALMKEPLNWLTVFLMCALALILLSLLAPQAAPEN